MIKQLEDVIDKVSKLSESEQKAIAQMILTTIEVRKKSNTWDTLEEMAGIIEEPEDWSEEHAHYLYGTPKNKIDDE
ncbi:hypothetical protein A5482_012175 [Cyanobacterium sp. IPPAS B-1200]|uniref:hypothetical protein n=1 Tax=Cyanobacterium sp. IPPAS B-1200 TaxID=1562720 RepID=UPI000852699B|nr:hypothetical protein [Cyanobacterium sp. IPPAS B-1200]OEJ77908.1 hypothetical protein A5482_14615 [Cyanobacterium sp. IPPAS B-1200]